jgi:hypothetical protein
VGLHLKTLLIFELGTLNCPTNLETSLRMKDSPGKLVQSIPMGIVCACISRTGKNNLEMLHPGQEQSNLVERVARFIEYSTFLILLARHMDYAHNLSSFPHHSFCTKLPSCNNDYVTLRPLINQQATLDLIRAITPLSLPRHFDQVNTKTSEFWQTSISRNWVRCVL